jgi:bifunctional DNase/RNase
MAYKYRRRRNKIANMAIIAFAAFIAAVFAGIAAVQYFSTDGFVEVNVLQVSGNSIIIGSNCTAIEATTSPERAQSIQQGIEGRMGDRPNTHDTAAEILRSFNVTADAVKFNRFDGRFFYSDMILRSGSKVLTLDMMPSDAIAIALRTNTTIYINSTMLAQMGKNIC